MEWNEFVVIYLTNLHLLDCEKVLKEIGMKLEVLLSTMNQNDLSIIQKMNIKGNAIIINQCNRIEYEELVEKSQIVKMYSFHEKGVGLSRNNALMRASGDICLFADDDVVYNDEYEEIILDAFKNHPDADVLIFNMNSLDCGGPAEIRKRSRVGYFNFMRYGTVNIALRRESIHKANIYFSLLFGGGAKYSAGEDSLFLYECIKKGLKIYTAPSYIGTVSNEVSTWFKGYNRKYFYDKGVFFANLSKVLSPFLIWQFVIRKHKIFKDEMGSLKALKYMFEGRKEFLHERGKYGSYKEEGSNC